MCIKVLVDRPTPTRGAHFVYACMCLVQWVKSTNSRSPQEKEGTRKGVWIIFLGAIKMHHPQQIRMQSLHAATKPDKTHMSMSEMHGSPYMTHPIR